jgi:MFS family permease
VIALQFGVKDCDVYYRGHFGPDAGVANRKWNSILVGVESHDERHVSEAQQAVENPEGVGSHADEQGFLSGPGRLQAVTTAYVSLFSVVGLALWGLPFYYDFMIREFGWTRAQVTSGNALSKLVVGPIFGFFAGWMVDRFGPRRILMAGIVMAGMALVGLGSVSTLGLFYFFYFLNAMGYVFGGPLPNQVLLSRWFDKSRGKAMGLAYLGIGCGGAAVPWISHLLVQHFGWQAALRMLGLLIFVIALPFAWFVKEPPRSRPSESRRNGETAQIRGAFKTLSFFLLTVGSMCSIAAVSGAQQNLKLFLSIDRHYAQVDATRILSLVLTFSIAGRLLMGWLADRFRKKYVMLLIYTIVAVSIPLLFLARTSGVLYFSAALFGIGLGGDYMIVPLVAAEIFGVQILGRLMGAILTLGGIAEAVSPWLIGRLRDTTGDYSQGCVVLASIALLGAAAALGLPRGQETA